MLRSCTGCLGSKSRATHGIQGSLNVLPAAEIEIYASTVVSCFVPLTGVSIDESFVVWLGFSERTYRRYSTSLDAALS